MKKQFLLFCFSLIFFALHAQDKAKISMNNDAVISINNGAVLTIDNDSDEAISLLGSGGKIISESEINKISWKIGSNIGTYHVPFANSQGSKLPLILEITSSGSSNGSILFSTYKGPDWNNSEYTPSEVIHMTDYETGLVNNSEKVVDRFWIINASSYSEKPNINMSIKYLDDDIQIDNNINEENLQAQRYNPDLNKWGDMLPIGEIYLATKTVNNIDVSAYNFHSVWTLVDKSSPLPIELSSFDVECFGSAKIVNWQTLSEINNEKFIIERSSNGIDFQMVAQIAGAGNSNSPIAYSWIDEENINNVYYRITQIDFDGKSETFAPLYVNCSDEKSDDFDFWATYTNEGDVMVNIKAPYDENANISIYDGIGKIIFQSDYKILEGNNRFILPFSNIATSIYYINCRTNSGFNKSEKLFVNKITF